MTIRKIAKRMELTEPAIYRHFKNKQDIVISLLNYADYHVNRVFNDIPEDKANYFAVLEHVFEAHLTLFENNRNLSTVIFSEEYFANDTVSAGVAKKILLNTEEKIQRIIKKGQESEQIRSDLTPEYICFLYMSIIRFLVQKWRLTQYEFEIKGKGQNYFQQVKKMILIT